MAEGTKYVKNRSSPMQIFYFQCCNETVINVIMHKQTLPSPPKHFGTVDAGVLLGDKGLFPFSEPEIKPD